MEGLDPFHAEIARVALVTAARYGFALAGGNALLAHRLVQRPTQDIDLFSVTPGAPGAVTELVVTALTRAGYHVTVVRPPEVSAGEFARLVVRHGNRAVELDLARDWRAHDPVPLDVGPVLHLDDAVASKIAAMVSRVEPRDYIDASPRL